MWDGEDDSTSGGDVLADDGTFGTQGGGVEARGKDAPHGGPGRGAAPRRVRRVVELQCTKKGLDGSVLSKERTNEIIHEMSVHSKFYTNEEKRAERVEARLEELLVKKRELELSGVPVRAERHVADLVARLEDTRDLTRTWVHFDMDAFFIQCALLTRPELRGVAAVVGRTIVSTSSYEARPMGIRSGMPTFIARKLAREAGRELHVLPIEFGVYKKHALRVRAIIARYDPTFQPAGVDESYAELSAFLRAHPEHTRKSAVAQIRADIARETGLTCSAGIAPNKRLAKMSSEVNKPNGMFETPWTRDALLAYVRALPVRKVPGIGKVSEHLLRGVDVHTLGDVWTHRVLLSQLFYASSFDFFLAASLALGTTEKRSRGPRKSVGAERTVGHRGLSSEEALMGVLDGIVHRVLFTMQREGLRAKCITLVSKDVEFRRHNRSHTLDDFSCDHDVIMATLRELLREQMPCTLRLIGVRLSGFPHTVESGKAAAPPPDVAPITSFLGDGAQEAPAEPLTCPVCGVFTTASALQLNVHLDDCLRMRASAKSAGAGKRKEGGRDGGGGKRVRGAMDAFVVRRK